jgi:hypothetical protein
VPILNRDADSPISIGKKKDGYPYPDGEHIFDKRRIRQLHQLRSVRYDQRQGGQADDTRGV